MKKRNTFLCCMLILIFTFIIPIQASAYDYNDNDFIIDFLPGDIDENNKVNSADARLCLRAAANLETLTDKQIKSVDFDGTGKINSANARSILRAAAKLETLSYTIKVVTGQNIIVGALQHSGVYFWECKKDSDNLFVDLVIEDTVPPDVIGGCDDMFYIINSESVGEFKISFNQQCPWTSDVNISFNLNIIIK